MRCARISDGLVHDPSLFHHRPRATRGHVLEEGAKMKSIVMAAVVAAGVALSGAANASEALAKSSGCMTCHDLATKKMGPSFKDIAGVQGQGRCREDAGGESDGGQGPCTGRQGVGSGHGHARQVGVGDVVAGGRRAEGRSAGQGSALPGLGPCRGRVPGGDPTLRVESRVRMRHEGAGGSPAMWSARTSVDRALTRRGANGMRSIVIAAVVAVGMTAAGTDGARKPWRRAAAA